jgi:hypothetical protein
MNSDKNCKLLINEPTLGASWKWWVVAHQSRSSGYFGFAADIAKSYSGYRFSFYLPDYMRRLSSEVL